MKFASILLLDTSASVYIHTTILDYLIPYRGLSFLKMGFPHNLLLSNTMGSGLGRQDSNNSVDILTQPSPSGWGGVTVHNRVTKSSRSRISLVDPTKTGDVLWSAEVEGTIEGCRYSPVSNKLVLLVTYKKRFKVNLNKLEQRVWIWDLNTGQSSKLDYIGCYPDMTLNNQGTRLLLAMPEQLLLWDVESAVQLHSLEIRSYMSSNTCFSGDDARIASDEGGVITVVESSSGRPLSSFNSLPLQQTLGASTVLLSHEGDMCGQHTRNVFAVWEVSSGSQILFVERPVQDVYFGNKDKVLILSSIVVTALSLLTKDVIFQIDISDRLRTLHITGFNPVRNSLFVGFDSNKLLEFDAATGSIIVACEMQPLTTMQYIFPSSHVAVLL
jgi:hypothetical protein